MQVILTIQRRLHQFLIPTLLTILLSNLHTMGARIRVHPMGVKMGPLGVQSPDSLGLLHKVGTPWASRVLILSCPRMDQVKDLLMGVHECR